MVDPMTPPSQLSDITRCAASGQRTPLIRGTIVCPQSRAFGSHPRAGSKVTLDMWVLDFRGVTDAKGSPTWPMSPDERLGKFLECTRWRGITHDAAHEAAERILDLQSQPNLDEIRTLTTRQAR